MQIFKALCRFSQKGLHTALYNTFTEIYDNQNVIDSEKYLYLKGDIPVLLVAHMDTVFKRSNHKIYFDCEENVLWGGPEGMGADDRAGIFGIIWLTTCYDFRPHILFVEDEEIGGRGAVAAINEERINPDNFKYIIELDRANQNDCVFYDCDNSEFEKYINSFDFITAHGTFSDISILCPAWKKAGVNLSIGYQNEHSLAEILVIHWMLETLEKVALMLEDIDNVDDFEYIPAQINFNFYQCDKCHKPTSYPHMIFIPKEYTLNKREGKKYCISCMRDNVNFCNTCDEFYETISENSPCPVCGLKGDTAVD